MNPSVLNGLLTVSLGLHSLLFALHGRAGGAAPNQGWGWVALNAVAGLGLMVYGVGLVAAGWPASRIELTVLVVVSAQFWQTEHRRRA